MTTEEQISKVREERDEARQELRNTLIEVSAKAEELEERLHPDRMVESSPIAAAALAGAVGFFLGSRAQPTIVGPVTFVALLGYAISKRFGIMKAEARKSEYRCDGRKTCCP
jgi:hypothetical protein